MLLEGKNFLQLQQIFQNVEQQMGLVIASKLKAHLEKRYMILKNGLLKKEQKNGYIMLSSQYKMLFLKIKRENSQSASVILETTQPI